MKECECSEEKQKTEQITDFKSRKRSLTPLSLAPEDGTSLLEVITVAAMSVIVAFSVYMLLDSIGPLQVDVQHRTELQGEGRIAMNEIIREVRGRKVFFNDTYGTMDSDHLQLSRVSTGGGTNVKVYFYTSPIAGATGRSSLKMYICRTGVCNPNNPGSTGIIKTLSNNVANANSTSDPIFTYFYRDTACPTAEADTIMCELTNAGNRPAGTRWVRIHLILDDDPSDTKRRYEMADDAAVRNN